MDIILPYIKGQGTHNSDEPSWKRNSCSTDKSTRRIVLEPPFLGVQGYRHKWGILIFKIRGLLFTLKSLMQIYVNEPKENINLGDGFSLRLSLLVTYILLKKFSLQLCSIKTLLLSTLWAMHTKWKKKKSSTCSFLIINYFNSIYTVYHYKS